MHESTHLLTAASALLLLSGCPTIGASVFLNDQNANVQLDLEGPCRGSGQTKDALGTSSWTKDDSTGQCVITIDWAGELMDSETLRDQVRDEAGKNVKSIEIEALTMTVRDVRLLDANGALVTPPFVPAFDASVEVDEEPVYSVDTEGLPQLLQSPLELTFAAPHPLLDTLNAVLNENGRLDSTAQIRLVLELENLASLQASGVNPHSVSFTHDLDIDAKATLGL